ncbi:hypothetical protein BHE74_00042551 [Ensete ventricosum]|nr:hypothetical protein BHE74_00042551 [Ensete ventricosum]
MYSTGWGSSSMASSSGSWLSLDGSLSLSSTGSITRSRPFLQRYSRLHGAGARMAVEGTEGFGMAGRGATFVFHTSWFNPSSWILAKGITAIRVYDFSPCCDFFGLGGQPMLNSAKSDRIFSSKRLSKASNSALMASSDAMV